MALSQQQIDVFRTRVENVARNMLAMREEIAKLNEIAKITNVVTDPLFTALPAAEQAAFETLISLMASYRIIMETPHNIYGLADIWGQPDPTLWVSNSTVVPMTELARYTLV